MRSSDHSRRKEIGGARTPPGGESATLVRGRAPFPLRRDARDRILPPPVVEALRNRQPRVRVRGADSATSEDARLLRRRPGPVPDSPRNRPRTSALRALATVLPVPGRQRNLRNASTRDWSTSGSITETSLAIAEDRCHPERSRGTPCHVIPRDP